MTISRNFNPVGRKSMVKKQVILDNDQASHLKAVATRLNKKEGELIREAVEKYLDELEIDKRLEDFMSAAGIWKDRKDLPDFKKVRKSLDRDFPIKG